MRRPPALPVGLAALLGLSGAAVAQDCRLALVLALDVSSSVDEEEDHGEQERAGGGLAERSSGAVVCLNVPAGKQRRHAHGE